MTDDDDATAPPNPFAHHGWEGKRRCRQCGAEFTPRRAWSAFCCEEHRQRWHTERTKVARRRLAQEDEEFGLGEGAPGAKKGRK